MATIVTGYTFGSGTVVTATKLNDAVNNATITIDSNEVTTAKILDANVTTAKLADGAVTNAKVADGAVVQVVEATPITALTTISSTIPFDNTKPTSTEGQEIFSQLINLKSPSNRVKIRCIVNGSAINASGSLSRLILALYRDSGASAIAASTLALPYSYSGQVILEYEDLPAAASVTYKIRAGYAVASWYMNGDGFNVGLFDGCSKSTLTLTEIKAS